MIQQCCLVQRATGPSVVAPELGGGAIKGGTVGCMPGIQGCPWRGHNVHGHRGQGPHSLSAVWKWGLCSQIPDHSCVVGMSDPPESSHGAQGGQWGYWYCGE